MPVIIWHNKPTRTDMVNLNTQADEILFHLEDLALGIIFRDIFVRKMKESPFHVHAIILLVGIPDCIERRK